MRNLQAARAAYVAGSAEASRIAHSQTVQVAHEAHLESGGRIKSLVFGGCANPASTDDHAGASFEAVLRPPSLAILDSPTNR